MKRFALLLFSLAFVTGLFAQEPKSYPLIDIIGTDSAYTITPFRTSDHTQVVFDFTGFSTDQVVINDVFYMFKSGTDAIYVPIEGYTFPVTLIKADHQTIVNGDTSNVVSFKLVNGFMGDGLTFKVTPVDAGILDILKVWFRK
jgi:hypothetical protein